MQIRLTVVDPLAPPSGARGRAASCDVLVTAPAGTALAAVASGLAQAVQAGDGPVVVYAGAERLDAQRATLGEPPLTDGAVLSLGAPADPEPHPELDDAPAQLQVVAGPDAGGVHLLHGGEVRVGRSADADVPLDDPDVSRLHCAVTLSADGRVTVADLGSTNGTTLDGGRVSDRPVRFAPGSLLRIGESALRLAPPGGPGTRGPTAPDGEGHVRVRHETLSATTAPTAGPHEGLTGTAPAVVPGQGGAPRAESHGTAPAPHAYGMPGPAGGPDPQAYGATDPSSGAHPGGAAPVPGPHGNGTAPLPCPHAPGAPDGLPGAAAGRPSADASAPDHRRALDTHGAGLPLGAYAQGEAAGHPDAGGRRGGGRRRGGLGAWARRLAGGRGTPEAAASDEEPYDVPVGEPAATVPPAAADAASARPETWPDPAALLLTALGPGPRLWERGPGHPEALTVRLGTADRATPDGSGLLPAVPVTAGLREAGALGLAGPRPRLAGLARAVVAQLAALHSPDLLEIVLISVDRSRPLEERTAEWAWLGWLPHVRPGHGQDCRLLLAYDREQAAARTDELLRRLADHHADQRRAQPHATAAAESALPGWETPAAAAGTPAPAGTPATFAPRSAARTAPGPMGSPAGPPPATTTAAAPSAAPFATTPRTASAETPPTHPAAPGSPAPGGSPTASRRPSWARPDDDPSGAPAFPGPYTVVVVDGDPGGAGLREAVARLALEGPRAGIHVVCLAETAPASPASPVSETYEAACAVAPTFRQCGAVALLSGDVASALRLLRVAPAPHPAPVGHGTLAVVDAVSAAWAERFARALAPLRPDGTGEKHARVSAPLPSSARLLDELGLARATPNSLMARWADAADDTEALGGRAWAVLGAGPRGPVTVDLVAEGPHLFVEGPPGSGRTELLRAVVASLAAAERPDRLGIVLMDGRDRAGGAGGDGLHVCTDVPHVTTHLTANDPVRMREFAQSLSAELKRRAELLGRADFAEWHRHREVSGRLVAQRPAPGARSAPGTRPSPAAPGAVSGAADLDAPPSSTLRLRPSAAARRQAETAPPLPRLVVVVDDLDALVSPPLGAPGRPSAGSVMRALEAVARDGERLGVHLVAAAQPGGRTAESEPARRAALRIVLDAPGDGPDAPSPGRGRLTSAQGRVTALQAGRVTGRIPRTATLRPTVVALEWHRMGDPPARRPVRELGNGPTDLALLASALQRAAKEVSAAHVPSLL
ncbi:FHA domain-containing protein [Streptomyces sp. NPDC127063]|uniref:FHA domain-containing protein n=1 Tax=Streptomyces sp. NPDC127063 TaxID=3347123 RepID=UPI00366068C6